MIILLFLILETFKPEIRIFNSKNIFSINEQEDFVLLYNVSSYPASDIIWLKSNNGSKYEQITQCLSSSQTCEEHKGNENITTKSFEVKEIKFRENNMFYKIKASNYEGNDSKTFRIQVAGKMNGLENVVVIYTDNSTILSLH